MRKFLSLLTSTSMLLAMTACSGDNNSTSESVSTVDQSDYDKLKADNSNLQDEYNKLKQELNELKNASTEAPTEKPTEAPTDAPTEAATEKKDEKKFLWEGDYVKITYVGTEESIWGTDVKLQIENISDTDLTVQVRDVSVNGFMIKPTFSCDVVAGKKANTEMSFRNLADEGIDTLESIEFYFHVFEHMKFGNNLEDSDTVTIEY